MNTSSTTTPSACHSCGEPRPLIIRCSRCGDRLDDSSELSPYTRLGLTPRPLYHEREVRLAEARLLDEFHTLRSSRHLARWALRQRALICRDAETLCSLGGALGSYLRDQIARSVKSDALDVTLSHEERLSYLHAARWSLPQMMSLKLLSGSALEDDLSSLTEDERVASGSTLGISLALERHLLEDAYHELEEYDGYQERERLLNRFTRELLARANEVAETLSKDHHISEWPRIASSINALSHLERWLDERRVYSTPSGEPR